MAKDIAEEVAERVANEYFQRELTNVIEAFGVIFCYYTFYLVQFALGMSTQFNKKDKQIYTALKKVLTR